MEIKKYYSSAALLIVSFIAVPVMANDYVFKKFLNNSAQTLDPSNAVDINSQHIINQIYSRLFKVDDDLSIEKHLVEDYKYISSQRKYTIILKPNIYFHNGKNLTSNDVIFTFRYYCSNTEGQQALLEIIKGCTPASKNNFGVKYIDKYIFSIELEKSFSPFLEYLATPQYSILPDKFAGMTKEAFFKAPVGTGPYKIDQLSQTKIVLLRFDKYFSKMNEIKKIEYICHDSSKALEMYYNNEIDDIYPLNPDPDKSTEKYQEIRYPQASTMLVAFKPNVAPFNDVNLRKAILEVIDPEEVKNILKNFKGYSIAHGLIPWGAIGYDQNLSLKKGSSANLNNYISKTIYKIPSKVPEMVVRSVENDNLSKVLAKYLVEKMIRAGFVAKHESVTLTELMELSEANKAKIFVTKINMSNQDSYYFLKLWGRQINHKGLTLYDNNVDSMINNSLNAENKLERIKIYKDLNNYIVNSIYAIPLGHLTYIVSKRKVGWLYPETGILGPHFINMNMISRNNIN